VLAAYRIVKNGSWPHLHSAMERRASAWPLAGEAELATELEGYVKETEARDSAVRVFWKLGPKFLFSGCNEGFARDAGIPAAELMGLDDFDSRLPWGGQASKYRADDMEVFEGGVPKLDILERQKSASGAIIWVRVGKAPIKAADGSARGVLGMYDMLDDKAAQKIFFERSQTKPKG
jgi:PAS domain-containing protein